VPYEIQFVASARRQLDALAVPERTGIVAAIEEQLSHEPQVETRNRKQLRPNPVAPWELRIGKARVFYDVEESAKVTILAIGKKEGDKLYIEGKEIQL
jgi:mRNA-degrading endonuclease RelE of RelBE toxin-antitoxin system